MRPLAASVLLACAAAAAHAAPVTYDLDPRHSQVEFTWSHFGYSHITARFDQVEGHFVYDAGNPAASSAQARVTVDSLDSGVDKLDAHLKSPDFFDQAQFAHAEFRSTRVEAAGEGRLKMSGDLTIHGITKPVTFDVTLNKVGEHPMKKIPAAGFDARATIRRSDFGMTMAVPNVSDEITIEVTVEAFARPAA